MKIRVYRMHLAKTLNFYHEKLTAKFGPIARSEAIKELIRLDIVNIQRQAARTERTNSWLIPVKIEFESNGIYRVVPENDNEILIID